MIPQLIGAAFEEAATLRQGSVGPDEILLELVGEALETMASTVLLGSIEQRPSS